MNKNTDNLIEKYCFSAPKDGVSLLVLAAVHGNETAGTDACRRLIGELQNGRRKLLGGKLTLVPVANPEAYRRQVRCVEENLNRVIAPHDRPTTYEQRLANEICPLIRQNDITLDLHSTHCEGDVPFAFCDYPNDINGRLIDALEVGYVLEGWPKIYADQSEISDCSTEQYAHLVGRTATTLECGWHRAPAATELAYRAIIGAMAAFGMIENNLPSLPQKKHIRMKEYIIKRRAGNLTHDYKHLDAVRRGDCLAVYDDGEKLPAPDDGYILLPNTDAEIGTEWYYFGTADR